MINLQSIRFQPSWQDIPCASSSVRGFACTHTPEENVNLPSIPKPTVAIRNTCPSNMFECDDGECVLLVHVCNGQEDCRNGTDERTDVCGEKHLLIFLMVWS